MQKNKQASVVRTQCRQSQLHGNTSRSARCVCARFKINTINKSPRIRGVTPAVASWELRRGRPGLLMERCALTSDLHFKSQITQTQSPPPSPAAPEGIIQSWWGTQWWPHILSLQLRPITGSPSGIHSDTWKAAICKQIHHRLQRPRVGFCEGSVSYSQSVFWVADKQYFHSGRRRRNAVFHRRLLSSIFCMMSK